MTHHVAFPYCTDQCFTKFVKIINFDQMLELGIQPNEIKNNLTHTCILEASCTRYIPEHQTFKLIMFDQNYFCSNVYFVNTTYFVIQ